MARKDKKTKKLAVRTEKLRQLTPVEQKDLGEVAGGAGIRGGTTGGALSYTCPTQPPC